MAGTMYFNGSIITMVGKEPACVGALSVKDGKIPAAGAQADLASAPG